MSSNNQTHYERLTPKEKLAVEIATRLLAARKNITGPDLQTLQARVQVCLKDSEIPEEVATKPRGWITAFGWQRAWFCDWISDFWTMKAVLDEGYDASTSSTESAGRETPNTEAEVEGRDAIESDAEGLGQEPTNSKAEEKEEKEKEEKEKEEKEKKEEDDDDDEVLIFVS